MEKPKNHETTASKRSQTQNEIVQKVLRHRTVNVCSELSRKKKNPTNYQKVKRTLRNRRKSIFSSGVPLAVNGCRKLRSRLIKIASDDDQPARVLKKQKVSARKISPSTHEKSETYPKIRSNGIKAFKEPLIEPLQQHEEVFEAADSISSHSVIVKVPHIIDATASPLTSQATATTEKHHQPAQNLSVILYSTKVAGNVSDPSSLEHQTGSSKFVNTLNTTEISVPSPCSANIVKKSDCVAQTIHCIDKDVTVLENHPLTKERLQSLTTSTIVATIVNSSSNLNLRFMILFRPIHRNQIELPYLQIYDKENWFRPLASLFPLLRINSDSSCMKSLQSLDRGIKKQKEDKTLYPSINCAIEWNKAMDKTLIRCLDDDSNVSPVHNQQYSENKDEIEIQKGDDTDCNKSMAAFVSAMETEKIVKTPNLTLRDRVEAKKSPEPEYLVIKLEVQPNLSNAHHPVNSQKYRKSPLSKNHLNLSSPIEMSKATPRVSQISTTKRSCMECGELSFVDPFSTDKCDECSKINKDSPSDTSEDEYSDNAVNILPANPIKRAFVPPVCTKKQSILSIPSLMTPGITLPLRPKVFSGNKTNYIKFLVKKPWEIKKQSNSILPRIQYPATVVSDPKSMHLIMQPGSAVQDQFLTQRSAESMRKQTCIKTFDFAPPLNLLSGGIQGFNPVHPDVVIDDSNTDEDIDVVSCCTPVRCDEQIGEFDYNKPLVTPPVPHHNVDIMLKPADPHDTMKRKFKPDQMPVDLSNDTVPPGVSLYAAQLHHHYRQTRKANTSRPPKLRAVNMKKPLRSSALENVNNDSSLLEGKDNISSTRCFDEDFLAEPSNSDSSLMSLSIHDFFADEDITFDEILTKYS